MRRYGTDAGVAMTFEEAIARLEACGVMSISTDEIRRFIFELMGQIAHLGPAVEIGSCYGGTAALMEWGGARVIAVDNWTLGTRDAFVRNMELLGLYVEVREGKSADLADTFKDRSLSYVMVDAWHWDQGPYMDYLLYAPKIAVGGYLLADAVANGHPAVIQGLVKWLANEPEARDFRFVRDFQRVHECSSSHHLTDCIAFKRVA